MPYNHAVSDGQLANETTFNGAFIPRNGDGNTIGKLDLNNFAIDSLSGADIINLQKNINAIASALGIPVNQVASYLIAWSSSVVGLSTSSSKDKIEALVLKFRDTFANGGHKHDGSDGEGPQLSITDILGINQFKAAWQGITIASAVGTSFNVSSYFSSETPGGDTNIAGVITTVPYNFCYVVDPLTNTFIEDAGGQRVYGRLTESAGMWTLAFYTNEGGVETAHNLPSQNIKLLYLKVFTLANLPTIESNPGEFGTLDVTADVVDASATLRGVVNLLAQSFAGNKTFNNNLATLGKLIGDDASDSTTTGSNAALPAPSKTALKLTNASLVSISTITGSTDKQFFLLLNKTGNQISLKYNDASNGILTFTGLDMDLPDNAAVLVWHDQSADRYVIIGGGGSGGGAPYQETPTGTVGAGNLVFTLSQTPQSADNLKVYVDGLILSKAHWSLVGSTLTYSSGYEPVVGQDHYVTYDTTTIPPVTPSQPTLIPSGSPAAPIIVGVGGITLPSANARQVLFIKSSGGQVDVTANPQISAGTNVGDELVLIGQNDVDYVTLEDGNGLYLNGIMDVKNKSSIWFVWDGTTWNEIARR